MIGALIFAAAVAAAGGFSVAMVFAQKFSRRRKREREFPVELIRGARSTSIPVAFTLKEVDNQLTNLANEWPDDEVFNIAALNVRWVEKSPIPEVAFYEPSTLTAVVSFGGVSEIWDTGLAHEAAHHALYVAGDHADHKTKRRPDIFSDKERGAVRRARELSGKIRYPTK